MHRPVGITILAVIAIVYGIFNLLIALLGLLGTALKASGVGAAAIKFSAGTLIYATISDALLGILLLVFGIGALQLKRWAWIVGVAAIALEVVRQVVGYVMQGFRPVTTVSGSITIVIAALLIWYLFRPNVTGAFGSAT
jgi:hypothetical protein